jgi:antibiotic biosynthesis monooxygenase (ABM) superfamily enzyme
MAVEEGRAVTGDDREPVARLPKAPKRWKQFCTTLAGVYPLTVVIPITLTWLSHFVPPLTVFAIRGMVSATLLVTCLMFVILPLFNKLFTRWLTRRGMTLS